MNTATIPNRTIERLSLYRRLLSDRLQRQQSFIFSHDLAAMVHVTPSQVRRDIMVTGCYGSPTRGYKVEELIAAISAVVDDDQPQNVVLVGLGKLGSALLHFFQGRRANLRIVAAFDSNPDKIGRLYAGIPCYPIGELASIVESAGVRTGIVAVPGEAAQDVANAMMLAGIVGILNFAPAPLYVPGNVFLESIDLTSSLEKVTFQARQRADAVLV